MNCKTLIYDMNSLIKTLKSVKIKEEMAAILYDLIVDLSGEEDDESLASHYSCKFNKFRKQIEMPAEINIVKKIVK